MPRRNKAFLLVGLSVILLYLAILFRRPPQQPDLDFDADGYGDVIGIDFGETSCRVGISDEKYGVQIIPDEQGRNMVPSYVTFTRQGPPLVGFEALDQAVSNPKNTISGIRRLLGRNFSDLEEDINALPYDVRDKDGKPIVKVQVKGLDKTFTPEEISSKLLEKLKNMAEMYLGRRVKYAVITVPAYFNEEQKQATKNAALLAGLVALRLVVEPTAAGIAYGHDNFDYEKWEYGRRHDEYRVLIYDLKAKSFDVTLESIELGVFEILSRARHGRLGGEDFENALLNHIIEEFNSKNDFDIRNDFEAMERLRDEVKKKEEILATNASTNIDIRVGQNYFVQSVTQSKLQSLRRNLFENTLTVVNQVLAAESKTDNQSNINGIILTGDDPSHIALIQPFLESHFPTSEFHTSIPPNETAVRGAAIQGRVLSSQVGESGCPLLDVTSISLGISTSSGQFQSLIPRNFVVPVRKTRIFTTVSDNQSKVILRIHGGEHPIADMNNLLGELELKTPKMLRGVPRIEVRFEIDADGALTVVARETSSQNKARLIIRDDFARYRMEKDGEMVMVAANSGQDDEFGVVLLEP